MLDQLQLKEGVQLTATKAVLEILRGVRPVYATFQVPCVVTSGGDGHHQENSKHYTGEALDFRIRDLQPEQMRTLVQLCQKRLGQDFDVVLEQSHLHVEYDPKVKKGVTHGE